MSAQRPQGEREEEPSRRTLGARLERYASRDPPASDESSSRDRRRPVSARSNRDVRVLRIYEYQIISDVGDVPVIADLGQPSIHTVLGIRSGNCLVFGAVYGLEALRYEGAVGSTCRVIRREGERVEECGGAVTSVNPVTVDLDGAGFRATDP